jgi:hypothetical protein
VLTAESLFNAARYQCVQRTAELRAMALPYLRARQVALEKRRRGTIQVPPAVWARYAAWAWLPGTPWDVSADTWGSADEQELPALPEQESALAARQAVVSAILERIERALPKNFRLASELCSWLFEVAQTVEVHGGWKAKAHKGEVTRKFTPTHWVAADRAAADAERLTFQDYVRNVSEAEAATIPRVPYRHAMSGMQRHRVERLLAERWDARPAERYWYPIDGPQPHDDVLVLQDAFVYLEIGVPKLQQAVLRRGVRSIWELNEFRLEPEYEIDPRLCRFYGGTEMYWFSRELDWLIYRSHEDSFTFAGNWLVNAIKDTMPNWHDRLYTG